jgi:uncharacterized protein (TIGR03437 family)
MKNIRMSLILLAAAIWPASAQVWDNTGNTLLNGQYYFREVTLTSTDAFAAYGTMTFTNGTYSTNATEIEAEQGEEQTYAPSGTYSIAASGFGFINNSSPSLTGSPIYGLVGANGVFVGSSTESGSIDIFIAAPLTSQSLGTLQGAYSLSYTDPLGEVTGTPFGALLQLSANGAGGIGSVDLTAYADGNPPATQTLSGVKYITSSGAYVLTFPASSTGLVQGQEYLYSTPDGSFVFGGSPVAFDMVVGVRTGTSGSSFGGLYYTAGFQIDETQVASGASPGYNSYYGSFNTSNGVILGHQRIQYGGPTAYSSTYVDSYPANSGGSYTDAYLSNQLIGGNGGAIQIGVGTGFLPGISVALQAPSLSSGSSVYLSPVGVENSASYAPFTAGISRGEYITLAGTNLGPSTLQVASTVPFATTLGDVKVLINGVAAPIYYVSANQLAVIVPVEINSGIAQIQVINNGSASNVVTEFVYETTPGVFSQQEDGIGYGAIEHSDGSLVTPDSPAQVGETVSVFMAGLGDVFPVVSDGAAAPSGSLANTSNTITADVSGTAATVSFAGLAPGFVGLYQVNVVIPSGVTDGDNFMDITGNTNSGQDLDSYNAQALISVGVAAAAVPGKQLHTRAHPMGGQHQPPIASRSARVPFPE